MREDTAVYALTTETNKNFLAKFIKPLSTEHFKASVGSVLLSESRPRYFVFVNNILHKHIATSDIDTSYHYHKPNYCPKWHFTRDMFILICNYEDSRPSC
jgi:hypothetical protein